MKSIRVLLAVSSFALLAGFAAANCGSCEGKDHGDKAPAKQCAAKCDAAKPGCEKDCDKPCCKKACSEADKAKCTAQKMACCEAAAKEGKSCEKCAAPAKE